MESSPFVVKSDHHIGSPPALPARCMDKLPLSSDVSRVSTPVPWPDGAQSAAMITFDVDAETMWLSRDPTNIRRPALISHGTYAAKIAIPEILAILREFAIKATFFVPG